MRNSLGKRIVSKNLPIYILHFGLPCDFCFGGKRFPRGFACLRNKIASQRIIPPNLQRPTTTTIATMAARDDSVAATGIRQVTQYDIAEVALVAEGEGEGRTAADERGAGTADEMDERRRWWRTGGLGSGRAEMMVADKRAR